MLFLLLMLHQIEIMTMTIVNAAVQRSGVELRVGFAHSDECKLVASQASSYGEGWADYCAHLQIADENLLPREATDLVCPGPLWKPRHPR
jgi:hypothetical protein